MAGMEANCMLYRANRLAPVALNLSDTCDAIRDDLNRLISEYWESEPTTDVHFIVEADRFCRFLKRQKGLPRNAREVLAREYAIVRAKLAASRKLGKKGTQFPISTKKGTEELSKTGVKVHFSENPF